MTLDSVDYTSIYLMGFSKIMEIRIKQITAHSPNGFNLVSSQYMVVKFTCLTERHFQYIDVHGDPVLKLYMENKYNHTHAYDIHILHVFPIQYILFSSLIGE